MDYIKALGVDVVWLSPIFASPQVDMGYDISDYKTIDPQYGSIEDVDTLMNGLHERGIKLLLDLVVNHTSDQHEWFKQSKSGKDNPYRDWYIWKKPRYDKENKRQPPNNWISHFGGSAWEYDEASDEYYLHLFAKEQPDLNWEYAPVRDAVHEIIRFWLSRGIDGFRLDVINYISKPQDYPDSTRPLPPPGSELYAVGPRLHEYLQGIGSILNEYNAFSVGEMPSVEDPKEVIKSVRYDRGELNMIFHFDFMCMDKGPDGKFTPRDWPLSELKSLAAKWQTFMYANGGWNALYLENHDQPRSVSRFGCDCPKHRVQSAKMLATFLACQAGTVFVYEGQELGMTNVPKEWPIEEYKDINSLNHWKALKSETSDPKILNEARVEYQKKSRDNARTPMQWTSDPISGGFSTSSNPSWMKVNPNTETINAAAQVNDPSSPFSYWQSVLAARKEYKDIIIYGDFELLDEKDEKVMAYTRTAEDGSVMLVVCNFSADEISWTSEGKVGSVKKVVLSSNGKTPSDFVGGKVALAAYEAFAVLLE